MSRKRYRVNPVALTLILYTPCKFRKASKENNLIERKEHKQLSNK